MTRILIVVGVLASFTGGGLYAYYKDAINIQTETIAERQARLEPHIEIYLPDSPGRRPGIVFFHGCGGMGPAELRAREAISRGYVAFMVDSLTPRGLDWQRVCAGRVLHGHERAGDVQVALSIARQHPRVDPDSLFLVGYSHGGWSVLEALRVNREPATGLVADAQDFLQGVQAVVTWYPYCHYPAQFTDGWDVELPVLMLLAELDEVAKPQPCQSVVNLQYSRNKPVSQITYPGVSHGFDELDDWVLHYDAAQHKNAIEAQYNYIRATLNGHP